MAMASQHISAIISSIFTRSLTERQATFADLISYAKREMEVEDDRRRLQGYVHLHPARNAFECAFRHNALHTVLNTTERLTLSKALKKSGTGMCKTYYQGSIRYTGILTGEGQEIGEWTYDVPRGSDYHRIVFDLHENISKYIPLKDVKVILETCF